ncbi:MAG: hypothetical protein KKH98_01785, partial [Spirochaetes bacterium]|nr:hypothetical protein [Spirochaetota bacterium]
MPNKFNLKKLLFTRPDVLTLRLLRDLVMLVVAATMIMIVVFSYKAIQIRKSISISLINRTTSEAENEFINILKPVAGNLTLIQKWGLSGTINITNTPSLTAQFIPLLEEFPHIFSLIIANSMGEEYILFKDKKTWITRTIRSSGTVAAAKWQRWENSEKIIQKWQKYLRYNPRLMPWYSEAVKRSKENGIYWTKSYVLLPEKYDCIFGSKSWTTKGKKETDTVVAINILIKDIIDLISGIEISENGKVFLLDNNMILVGLSFSKKNIKSPASITYSPLNKSTAPVISDAARVWQLNKEKTTHPFRFKNRG